MSIIADSGPILSFARANQLELLHQVIGGLTPIAATWLVARTGDDLSPAYMIMAAAAVSTVALLFVPETFRQRFQAGAQPATT